ncbi:LCP family protein [Micromonospora sp. WMMD882]|uniref:LCP family protein n=1 Tax=Micromonospora sp. WMMD882 TaxID=3015151 RepID=UPI00248BD788|nr:LCP family protein [Micromonospora sp. WMMD882]WBB82470.1 LCP family protein [Micromonospora sp. WMMD882]
MLATAGTIGIQALTDRYDNSVARGHLLDDRARRERTDPDGPLTYLLVGSDRFRSSGEHVDERSDTILIAHLPAGLHRAYLISVPRDLLVAIPPAPNGYRGGQDKINAAYDLGGGGEAGSRLLSATLHRLTGLEFDGAASIDFTGLRTVIDLLGGVRMCVDTEVRSVHTGTVFVPGCQQMDGARALDYVRQRYDLPGGDYDRQRHQQQLLRAMLQRAGETDLRGNPLRTDQIIRAVGGSLTVDTNGVPLEDLVLSLRALPTDGLVGVQVPSAPQTIDQVSYVVLVDGGNGLFESVRTARAAQWAAANRRWVNRL